MIRGGGDANKCHQSTSYPWRANCPPQPPPPSRPCSEKRCQKVSQEAVFNNDDKNGHGKPEETLRALKEERGQREEEESAQRKRKEEIQQASSEASKRSKKSAPEDLREHVAVATQVNQKYDRQVHSLMPTALESLPVMWVGIWRAAAAVATCPAIGNSVSSEIKMSKTLEEYQQQANFTRYISTLKLVCGGGLLDSCQQLEVLRNSCGHLSEEQREAAANMGAVAQRAVDTIKDALSKTCRYLGHSQSNETLLTLNSNGWSSVEQTAMQLAERYTSSEWRERANTCDAALAELSTGLSAAANEMEALYFKERTCRERITANVSHYQGKIMNLYLDSLKMNHDITRDKESAEKGLSEAELGNAELNATCQVLEERLNNQIDKNLMSETLRLIEKVNSARSLKDNGAAMEKIMQKTRDNLRKVTEKAVSINQDFDSDIGGRTENRAVFQRKDSISQF